MEIKQKKGFLAQNAKNPLKNKKRETFISPKELFYILNFNAIIITTMTTNSMC